MAQSQLRSDELVAFPIINGRPLGLFSEIPLPEPDIDEQTYPKPLRKGSFSAGGNVTFDTVEAWREFDPNTDEALYAFLRPLMGNGEGTLPYHPAPNHQPRATPLAGHTYDVKLLRVWTSEGANADAGAIVRLNVEFGIQGEGR